MTLFDIICILIVLGGALYGWRRGVMSQAGSVVGIVAAICYDRRLKEKGGLSFTIVRLF